MSVSVSRAWRGEFVNVSVVVHTVGHGGGSLCV